MIAVWLASAEALFAEHGVGVRMSETASPGARYRIGAYRFWHRHVAVLLEAARPDLDADYLAHALLSVLAADTHMALREHTDGDRIRGGVRALAALMLTGVADCGRT